LHTKQLQSKLQDVGTRPQLLNIRPQELWIALLPVLVFIFGEWFLTAFGSYTIEVTRKNGFDAVAEAGGRYSVYATFLLFVGVCIGVTWIFYEDVRRLFNRKSRRRLTAMVAGLGAVVFVVIVVGPEVWSTPKTYWFAGRTLFDDLLSKGKIEWCKTAGEDWNASLEPAECEQWISLAVVFVWILKISGVLIAIAAGSAIAGAISSLGSVDGKVLPDQWGRLNQYLYLGAALMVSGMLLIMSWLHWPDFYFSKDSSYTALANGLTIYYGINYSMIIFAYYAPVAFLLAQRTAAGQAEPDKSALPTAKKPHDFSMSSTFGVVFALLSPLLTGFLGTLLSMLGYLQ
jgi:hypothetical protein